MLPQLPQGRGLRDSIVFSKNKKSLLILILSCLLPLVMLFYLNWDEIWKDVGYGSYALLFIGFGILSRLIDYSVYETIIFSFELPVYIACFLTFETYPTIICMLATQLTGEVYDHVFHKVTNKRPLVAAARFLINSVLGITVFSFLSVGFNFHKNFSDAVYNGDIYRAILFFAITSTAVIVPMNLMTGLIYSLGGVGKRRVYSDVILTKLRNDTILLPICFAMIWCFKRHDIIVGGALSISYLIFCLILRNLGVATHRLGSHTQELKVIEQASMASMRLDIEDVGRLLGTIIMNAIEGIRGSVLTIMPNHDGGIKHYVRTAFRGEKMVVLTKVLEKLGQPLPDEFISRYSSTPTQQMLNMPKLGYVETFPLKRPDGSVQGYLSVVVSEGYILTKEDLRILEHVAKQASLSVENYLLYIMATEDYLTRLFVRRYLIARLSEEMERSTRIGAKFCLLMIDVDNLKDVNDTYGHQIGDELLKLVAKTIKDAVRAMDVPARLGGDEFAVILINMDIQEGFQVAQRIVGLIRQQSIKCENAIIKISASIGIVGYPHTHAKNPEELLKTADDALYMVKRSGNKGRVVAVGTADNTDPDAK